MHRNLTQDFEDQVHNNQDPVYHNQDLMHQDCCWLDWVHQDCLERFHRDCCLQNFVHKDWVLILLGRWVPHLIRHLLIHYCRQHCCRFLCLKFRIPVRYLIGKQQSRPEYIRPKIKYNILKWYSKIHALRKKMFLRIFFQDFLPILPSSR